MFSSISTPVVFILALVIGLLIGVLVSTLFNREPKTSGENPVPEKYTQDGYAEAARILYTPAARRSMLYLDGDYYERFDVLTPEQKKRVQRLVESLNEWAGTPPKPAVVEPSATVPAVRAFEPAATVPSVKSAAVQPLTQLNPAMPPLPKAADLLTPAPKPETLEDLGIDVPSVVTPIPAVISVASRVPKVIEKPKSIVEQINAHLEDIVAGTPNACKGIHLEDNGHQGVVVWVGLSHYEGVDAVPDKEVQGLIKEAVSRWEESSVK